MTEVTPKEMTDTEEQAWAAKTAAHNAWTKEQVDQKHTELDALIGGLKIATPEDAERAKAMQDALSIFKRNWRNMVTDKFYPVTDPAPSE